METEDWKLLTKLLDRYGFSISLKHSGEVTLFQEVSQFNNIEECLDWIIKEFDEK